MHARPTRPPPPSRRTRSPWPVAAASMLMQLCLAPAWAEPPLSSTSELSAGQARAQATLMADRTACGKLVGTERDTCRERAQGKELVTRAELDLAHTGTPRAQLKVETVKLGTIYDLARARCNDKAGSAKTACTHQAQSVRTRGQAELNRKAQPADAGSAAVDGHP